ncbi:ABC transporter substrate-binding protein, partial [Balneolaceae bacterium ANBcel3]|nr:ABC transporter substrate-binding protein [Balneolaceae bacterium ANBcel3]
YFIPILFLFLASCGDTDSGSEKDSEWTITDMLGRTVVFEERPETAIGLRAGALRLLVYLDAVDMVAGIEEPEREAMRPYLYAWPELRHKRVAGPLMGGDTEMLVSIQPDVIFLTFTTAGQADDLQRRTGIPVVALEYGNFYDQMEVFFEALHLMADVLGREERAKNLEYEIRKQLHELEERTADIPDNERKNVYVGGVSYRGARGIQSTEPFYPSLQFIHAINLASTLNESLINPIQGTYVDVEQILLWDPDILFIDMAGWNAIRNELRSGTPLAETLTARKKGEIYALHPYNNYAANYETILANAWYAGSVLYPDRFSDIDIQEKSNQIYTLFLGQPVYNEMAEEFGPYENISDLLD